MARPHTSEYAPYYSTYIDKVPEGEIISLLQQTFEGFQSLLSTVEESKADYRYAPEKWTIKQVLQHIIDTERVMAYRALRVARGDDTPMPGFDQDVFADSANVSNRSLASQIEELRYVRQSTILFYQSLHQDDLLRKGTASANPVSTRSLAYIILGHLLHHQEILEERYLGSK